VAGTVEYPIYEQFWTIQGEGVHTGRRMYLLRLMGCDQRCPWCDAAGTWHKNYLPKEAEYVTPREVLEYHTPGDILLVTGGEPTLYDLQPLTTAAFAKGVLTHIETAGHHPIRGDFNWVTLSPKFFDGSKPPVESVVERADEVKLIVEGDENLREQLVWLYSNRKVLRSDAVVWLHPEWSKRNDRKLLQSILDTVLWSSYSRTFDLRAGWQTHKLYLADPNPQGVVVPLGGDPTKGDPL